MDLSRFPRRRYAQGVPPLEFLAHFTQALRVGSGSSHTHGGMLAGFLGNRISIPPVGIGVGRDPADQDPLVHKEAQAVADLLGLTELTS